MTEVAECCGCCLLCCACASVCGRLCLWIPWPGRKQKAKDIEADEEFARQVERDIFAMPPHNVQPAPRQGPIVKPDRRSRNPPNGGRSNDGPPNRTHAQQPSISRSPDRQDSLPQRISERISQDPNLKPPNYEYPPQPSREPGSTHVGDRHSREPSATSNGFAAQQRAASSPPNANGPGSDH